MVRRPALADDTASSESALLHALDVLDRMGLRHQLVFLQCTSPFTGGEQIDQVLAALAAGGEQQLRRRRLGMASSGGPMAAASTTTRTQPRQRRQDLEPAYLETGAIYAMDMAAFRDSGSRFCPLATGGDRASRPGDRHD